MVDLTIYTKTQLNDLYRDVLLELDRRQVLESAEQQSEDLAKSYLKARDTETPEGQNAEWTQPTGAHDAYPQNWEVHHGGKDWVSLISANVWEPGVSGWREKASVPTDPEAPVTVPDFVQPTGAHDAYSVGDKVTFEGAVYTSTIDANVYSPTAYPAGWTKEA